MRKIWIAGTLAVMLAAGALGAAPARASTSGRRNTAIGLGAAAIYELVKGNTVAGVALGAGAAYGYKRYEDAKRYQDRYGYWGRGYRGARYDSGAWRSSDGYRRVNDRDDRDGNDRWAAGRRSSRRWSR